MKRLFAIILALSAMLLSSCDFTENLLQNLQNGQQQSDVSFVYSVPEYKDFTANTNETGEPLVILNYEVNANDYYYRSLLSEAECEVYDIIATAVMRYEYATVIPNLAGDDNFIKKIINAYHNDHPETFYWNGNMLYRENTLNGTIELEFEYMLSKETAERYADEINEAEDEYFKLINENTTQYDAMVIIHDLLCNNISYPEYVSETPDETSTIFGALVNKSAVCAGYAHAFKYLCNKVGINVINVMGNADNEAHQWNMVTIGNESFFVDVTWDDPVMDDGSQSTIYQFFGMTNEELSKTHTITGTFKLPSCDTNKYNYCEKYGFVIDNQNEVRNILVKAISFTVKEKPEYSEDTIEIFLKIDTDTCQYEEACDIILSEFEAAMDELYYSNILTLRSWNMSYSMGEDILPYVSMAITLE